MIATFFAVLMLMVPLSTVTGTGEMIEKLESKYEKQEFSSTVVKDAGTSLVDMFYMLGEQDLNIIILTIYEYLEDLGLENIQSGEIVVNSEELESVAMGALNAQQTGFFDTVGVGTTGMGDELYPEGEESDGESEILCEGEIQLQFESEELPLWGDGKTLWERILEWIRNNKGRLIEIIAGADIPQFGYINGFADFYVLQKDLMAQFKKNLSPNLTGVQVRERTIEGLILLEEWLNEQGTPINLIDEDKWANFSVHDFLFVDLQTWLIDKAENHTRIFEGFGIRAEIYEQYILPILVDWAIPYLIQMRYDGLNEKVEWESGPLEDIKDTFQNFMVVFGDGGKVRRSRILGNFTSLIKTIFKLALVSGLYYIYMNETQIEEYFRVLGESGLEYITAWDDFISWTSKGPWRDPISINGTVVGPDGGRFDNILVYCDVDPETSVLTNETGYFEDLIYDTKGGSPYGFGLTCGLHLCVTTAYDEENDIGVTVGNLDENDNITAWILNRVLVGSFSGGNITLHIDFDGENNNVLLQSQSSAVMR